MRVDRAGYSRMLNGFSALMTMAALMQGSCFAGVGTVPMPRSAKPRVTTKFSGGLNGTRAVQRRERQRLKREHKNFVPIKMRMAYEYDMDDCVDLCGRL